MLSTCLTQGQNAIVTENALIGNPYSDWGVNSSADFRNANINGYATDISVNKGATIHFKVDGQNGVPFTIQIYRLGYYNGLGARLIQDLGSFAGLKQNPGIADPTTGLLDCSNWIETTTWTVPNGAVSGVYIAKLESAAGRNHIVFIVRDDASNSKLFFQANDASWQAYNGYGGNNFYNGTTSYPAGHAVKVSYNRPFFIYNAAFQTDGRGSDWYMNDTYPMLRWLERNGYDMSYTTNTDVARAGNLITNHKIFVTAGHDEYCSKEQRTSMEAARAAGVNLAFFTGNETYWKTRWEADGNGNANRVLVCYKEGTLADGTNGEAACGTKCDASLPPIWTGLWRMGAAYDAPLPENALTGQMSWDQPPGPGYGVPILVPDTYKNLRFWRNTSVATLGTGATASLSPNALGYEFDYEQFPQTYPHGRILLSSTSLNGHTHKLSLYRNGGTGGPLVFGAGTIQWAWALDAQHFGGIGNAVDKDLQQATVNLFADMGVQPATLQSDLTAATLSSDFTPPASIITAPANGSSAPAGTTVTITGTATDVGGVVAGVEVSVDGGATWQVATGTNNWTFSWSPGLEGAYVIKSRAFDDSGNMEDGTVTSGPNVINITITPAVCPCHIFNAQIPADVTNNDAQPIELGIKFKSSENGFITGVRFYKSTGNTGTHIGELYTTAGVKLASATFTGETASGWQTVSFSAPVAVTANTTYVAAYFSSGGNYTGTANYFTTSVVNSPLTGLADGIDGPNGVYLYTPAASYPTSTSNKSNYWVDVIFSTTLSATAHAGTDQSIVLPTSSVTLDGSGSTGVITDYTWTNISGPNTPVITSPGAVSTTVTGLIAGTYIFQLSINAGASTSQVTVHVLPAGSSITIFTVQTPVGGTSNDGQPIELGVKFQSSQAGYINGVRFYKTAGNAGIHIGELYSSNGTKLANATFSGETATGWQTVMFSAPVAITANTTYIAAYFSTGGTYTGTVNYFSGPVVNSPLTGLANGTDGPNGIYIYTPSPAFPTTDPGNKTNYWVDALFSTTISTVTANAGIDQTIVLPTSSVTMDGSASTGAITSYAWTQISGPNTSTITSPSTVSTTVTGLIQGTYVFQLSVNGGIRTAQVTITVLPAGSSITIFTTQTPVEGTSNDGQPIELGVKFQSSQAGYINGVRFYKTAGNNGIHTGELYAKDGTRLASATFSGETATGWQTVSFNTPVAITANTTYIAAYFSPGGTYTGTPNYFATAVVNSPLTGLADGTDGPNGVYQYTASSAFPSTSAGNKPNYWVDAMFSTTLNSVIANAGPDQTIVLPTASASLDGSASTGTIASYSWTQISGPNAATITTPTTVGTSVTGLIAGTYVFQLSLNGGISTSNVTVKVLPVGSYITIFTTQTPAEGTSNDGQPIELGVKFRSSSAGYITGVRFYKTANNNGIHVGELYTVNGTKLANATFSGETASGWQTVTFSTPVLITANTTYIAAYFSPNGTYTGTPNYFTTAVVNTPLTGLADGTDGPNGVFLYTPGPAFPNNSAGNKPNYWVDVTFTNTLPTVIANAGKDQTIILPVSTVTLDGTATTGTITDYTWTNISGPSIPAFTTPNAVTTNVTGLAVGTYVFQLSVNGGISTSTVTVNVLPFGSAITIFTNQTPPDDITNNDGQAIELGVKFQSSQTGYINGIRFYKTTGNTGVHIGELYTSSGTLLASATFINETALGWQNVVFSSPVPITANTTYIAAYFSPLGNYKGTANYFTSAVVNNPLTGLADGTDGPNGLYLYTPTPSFPNNSAGNKPNYWVDAVFTESSTPLPVLYLSFNATRQGNDVKLQWTTTIETNNKGFEIQRSTDGAQWDMIGFVAGAGNSEVNQNYQYIDKSLTPAKYYYRLRQVDLDGKYDFSKIVTVTITGELSMELLQNRPNPFNNSTTIIIILPRSGRISLTVFDQMGRPVRALLDAVKQPGTYSIIMNRDGLSTGMYYYKLDGLGQSQVRKMTID